MAPAEEEQQAKADARVAEQKTNAELKAAAQAYLRQYGFPTLQHCVACYVCCYMTLAHVVHCGALRCVAASQSVM